MIEFMDLIAEAVEGFLDNIIENTIIAMGILAKVIILLTAPVWVLPYIMLKDIAQDYEQTKKINEGQGKEDAGNND